MARDTGAVVEVPNSTIRRQHRDQVRELQRQRDATIDHSVQLRSDHRRDMALQATQYQQEGLQMAHDAHAAVEVSQSTERRQHRNEIARREYQYKAAERTINFLSPSEWNIQNAQNHTMDLYATPDVLQRH